MRSQIASNLGITAGGIAIDQLLKALGKGGGGSFTVGAAVAILESARSACTGLICKSNG